jgi:hypothetical protein
MKNTREDVDIEDFLDESGGVPVRKGNRWLVTIAVPGQGQTGIYSEQVLKETGPDAFPPGTKAFWGHTSRDARDMVGTYPDGAFWNEEEGKLQAYLTPFGRYRNVLDEAGSNIEASIHSHSTKDPRTGVVKSLNPHRGNTVDLVAFAGLAGSGLEYQVESLFSNVSATGEIKKEKKENNVEITQEMWNAQAATITAIATRFDTFANEAMGTVQGVADEAAVESLVAARLEEALTAYAETESVIEVADILPSQKESLKARARAGQDITDALAEAVSFVKEAKDSFVPASPSGARQSVIVTESMNENKPNTFAVRQWGK